MPQTQQNETEMIAILSPGTVFEYEGQAFTLKAIKSKRRGAAMRVETEEGSVFMLGFKEEVRIIRLPEND